MMENVKIFVEGIADVRFIQQYLKFELNIDLLPKVQLISVNGWDKISSLKKEGEAIRLEMQKNTDNGGVNLVIFDADKDFSLRQSDILKWKTTYKLNFELFLFPNNSEMGALEDLLEKIINPANEPIFDCWKGYEKCIATKFIEGRTFPLTIPAKKTKIYGYLETLLGSSHSEKEKIKEKNRNYLDSNHWKLESESLNPLQEFLTRYLKEKIPIS